MTAARDPIAEAIERGTAVGRVLVTHRDAIIHHLAAVYLIAGPDGLRACAAGAAEAVIIAAQRQARAEVVPFPPKAGAA